MARTKRIYNRQPILGGPGLQGWIMSNMDDPDVEELAHDYVFRRHGYYCMGNCPSCKSHDKRDQKRKTAKKAEVRQVSEEFAAFGLFTDDSPYLTDPDTLRDLAHMWDDYIYQENDFLYADW